MSNPIEPNKPDLNEPELISIIEGPPPQFQFADEHPLIGMLDSTGPYEVARCDTRTFNGPKLMARCHNAWRDRRVVMLEYRDLDGMKQRVEICGIHYEEVDEGTLLQLWVRLPVEMQLIEIDEDPEAFDDEDDDEPFDEGKDGFDETE